MLFRNKELRTPFLLYLLFTFLSTICAFFHSWVCGLLVFLSSLVCGSFLIFIERSRYRKLQQISLDLDALLLRGVTLPIEDYEEGDLSVLAHQVQKLTRNLTAAQQSLQKDKNFLTDSLADISHQLRTPLTAMHLTLSLLSESDTDPEKRRKLLRDLRTLLNRTQWLVEALLKLTKLDAGTAQLRPESIGLKALLDRSISPFSISMELREQQLVLHCEDHDLICDPVWTSEAIGNVLKNAIEYSPPGSTISLSGKETALFTEIVVQDQGSGFSEKDLPKIFDRFYRGDREDTNSCGIGLSLSRSILSAQNGTIQAENTKTGGKFTIKLYKDPL